VDVTKFNEVKIHGKSLSFVRNHCKSLKCMVMDIKYSSFPESEYVFLMLRFNPERDHFLTQGTAME